MEPLLEKFEEKTGITVQTRFGGTPQLALALHQEGARSQADLFWAQDAGALGNVSDLLQKLPEDLVNQVDDSIRHPEGLWIATSGRARVLAYSSVRVEEAELPKTLDGLTDPQWKSRIGWAPTNGSFQSFVTAMRLTVGEEKTQAWLTAVKSNDAKAYSNNSSLLQGLAAGEIDVALTNHYYLYRMLERDKNFPVKQTFFEADSPGNLVNFAGIGLLQTSKNSEAAKQLIAFLLSETGQKYFTDTVFEYPVKSDVEGYADMIRFSELQELSPDISLDQLEDLSGTIKLLREVDLL